MSMSANKFTNHNFNYYKSKILNNQFEFELNVVGFEYYPKKNEHSLPAAALLLEAFDSIKFNTDLVKDLETILSYSSNGKTVWGIRNENGTYSLEYYFYYPTKYPENAFSKTTKFLASYTSSKKLHSINIEYDDCYLVSYNPVENKIAGFNFYRKCSFIDESNNNLLYLKNSDANQIAFSWSYNLETGEIKHRNTYYGHINAPSKIYTILSELIEVCVNLFPNENPNFILDYLKLPYLAINHCIENNAAICPYCFTIKDSKFIGLYFFALPFDNFIMFLKHHNYPVKFIENIKSKKTQLEHLKFDIVIDVYIEHNEFKIKKSAFFGSL
jgi:hypothetical protein